MNIREILKKKIVYIILFAFFLRIISFRAAETFTASDEIYLFQNSLKPLTFLLGYSFSDYAAELFRFFNFNWGWGTPAIDTIFIFFLHILRIPLTEATIEFPYVLVGTATIYLIYLLGKEIKDEWLGLCAALLMAITPEQVSISRSGGVNTIAATFFFLLTLYLFLCYFKERKYPYLCFFILGIYFGVDFQFYGILPLLLLLGMLFRYTGNPLKDSISVFKEFFWTPRIFLSFIPLIPIILAAFYLLSIHFIQNSYLLHIFQKTNYWGFYVLDFASILYKNVGPLLFLLFVLSLGYCLFLLSKKRLDKMYLFVFMWFCIEVFPWLFIVDPITTVEFDYIMHPTSALFLLSAFFLSDLRNRLQNRKLLFSLLCLAILIPTLLMTSAVVYKKIPFYKDYSLTYKEQKGATLMEVFGTILQVHRGTKGVNTGIKSAGYYVREQTNASVILFSDQESFITEYYMGRKVVGDLDLFEEEEILESFEKWSNTTNIHYIYLEQKNYSLLKKKISEYGFSPAAIITQGNRTLGTLYGKQMMESTLLDISTNDPLFDQKYGNIDSLYVDYS